jgi:hypothetical protein
MASNPPVLKATSLTDLRLRVSARSGDSALA